MEAAGKNGGGSASAGLVPVFVSSVSFWGTPQTDIGRPGKPVSE